MYFFFPVSRFPKTPSFVAWFGLVDILGWLIYWQAIGPRAAFNSMRWYLGVFFHVENGWNEWTKETCLQVAMWDEDIRNEALRMIQLCQDVLQRVMVWQNLAWRVLLTHVDAWLCILSSPLHSWASWCRDVYPQWWRPKQTASKSSHAPCIALLLYS